MFKPKKRKQIEILTGSIAIIDNVLNNTYPSSKEKYSHYKHNIKTTSSKYWNCQHFTKGRKWFKVPDNENTGHVQGWDRWDKGSGEEERCRVGKDSHGKDLVEPHEFVIGYQGDSSLKLVHTLHHKIVV